MTVADLVRVLTTMPQDREVVVTGCYGSTGQIESVIVSEHPDDSLTYPKDKRRQCVLLCSDICSG